MSILHRKEEQQPPYNSLGYVMDRADRMKENAFYDTFYQKIIDVCSQAIAHPTVALRQILPLPVVDDWGVGILATDAIADMSLPKSQGYIDLHYFYDEPGKPFLNTQIIYDDDGPEDKTFRCVCVTVNMASAEMHQWTHHSSLPSELSIGNALITLASAQRDVMHQLATRPGLLLNREEVDKRN